MIAFSVLRYKNFLSSGNAFTTIQFDAHPTTLVVGKNGSGKSTMLDALCFVLFGKPFRKINKPQLLNSINQKNCVVEIEFTIGQRQFKIVRGIKPNIFEIYQDGVVLNQDAASKDYQKYLEENILKLNFKSFTQIVILGVASFTPFMELPAASRREIIEDILDIRIFSVMNLLLKEKVASIKEGLQTIEGDLKINMHKTKLQDAYIKSLQADRQERIDELDKKLENAENEINMRAKTIIQHVIDLDVLSNLCGNIGTIRASHADIAALIRDMEKEISQIQREGDFYGNHTTCPTCKQNIGEEVREEHIEATRKRIAEISQNIETQKILLAEKADELSFKAKAEEGIAKLNQQIAFEEGNIETQKRFIASFYKEKGELQAKAGNIEEERVKLKTMAKEVVAMTTVRSMLKEEKDYHDVAVALLKDGGVKTRIIKQYLPAINKLVNKYLHAMDFFVSFDLDEQFNEKIKSRHRDEFSYESFSQGEKQRIDLALVFTWRTIAKMKNSTSTNLLILDEVFDSSLDTEAVDYVINLLNAVGEQTNVWVISHKGDQLVDKFANTLQFVKKNNYSIIV